MNVYTPGHQFLTLVPTVEMPQYHKCIGLDIMCIDK